MESIIHNTIILVKNLTATNDNFCMTLIVGFDFLSKNIEILSLVVAYQNYCLSEGHTHFTETIFTINFHA